MRLQGFLLEQRFQQMPMTMRLVFAAMAEQRHGLIFGQMLKEPQREYFRP